MNQITNSVVKEQFRQRNESYAQSKEAQIRSQLNQDCNQLTHKASRELTPFLIGGGILGIVIAVSGGGFIGFLCGGGVGLAAWGIANASVKNFNNEQDQKRLSLQAEAERKIRDVYIQADQQTQAEINAYDRAVQQHCQQILSKRESVSPMVDHVVNMFQRMISHADSGPHMRFVEADFTYQVVNTGIRYQYQSRYTNPQDDFNFNKQRYRDLSTPAECEGLAQALAKLVISKMKQTYPPNSINITLDHIDASVTMHFKGANKNFVPARDIY